MTDNNKSVINYQVKKLSDGRKMGFAEYGEAKGKAVLFFHGAPGSSHIHLDLAKIAAQNNARLIAVDRPGYGMSDSHPERTLTSFADDIDELTNSLNLNKFSIIGFSAGSPYPIAYAIKYPGRVAKIALVGALAPVNAPGVMEGMSPMAAGLYALAQSSPADLRAAFAAVAPSAHALFGAMSASAGEWDKNVLQARAAEFELEYEQTLIGGTEGMASDFILNSGNWGVAISECKTEVHLFSGGIDQNTPTAMTHYLSTQLPNNHVHIFQNEGHFVLYTHWKEILQALI